MKWIARGAAVLVLLALVAAGGAAWYFRRFVTSPAAPEPGGSILRHLTPPLALPAEPPAWERRARADRGADFDLGAFREPPREYAPWTRWWWPGNAVERAELERELALFAAAGFGGVEIQAFGIHVSREDRRDPRWRSDGWDSPAFYANLRAALEAAHAHGLAVDLNNGSGWPTGGPQVALEDGPRQLVHSELFVTGPSQLEAALPAPRLPAAYLTGNLLGLLAGRPLAVFLPEKRELLAVVAARVLRDGRTRSPLDTQDQVALDSASRVVLGDARDGRLRWSVPAGEWAVVALWEMPNGEHVSADAIPDPAYVVDPLDADRIRANQDYLLGERTGLTPWFGAPLRAYFDDSLEFKAERHLARGELAEFERRRGYDPRPWLPALVEPGHDQMPFHAARVASAPEYDLGEPGRRFAEDWAETTSELFLERFLGASGRWAAERGLAHRVQAYGAELDVLRAAGLADIPEAEQLYASGSELFLKAVASGAQLYERPLVTAESFVHMRRAFMSTPAKIRAFADKALQSGINQIIYHGSAYQVREPAARGYPEAGWYPWVLGMFSTDASEATPWFAHVAALNRYIARVQYALRLGRPETDVLVVYPGLGFPQAYANPEEPLDDGRFEGEPALAPPGLSFPGLAIEETPAETAWLRDTWRALRELERRGLSWAWVNEHRLAEARLENGALMAGGLRARALLLHQLEAMAPAAAERVAALAEAGLPVRVDGAAPARQRGLADAEAGDARVRAALARVRAAARVFPDGALRYEHPDVQAIRRRLANGDLVAFFRNSTAEPTALRLRPTESFASGAWLDAWDGRAVAAEPGADGGIETEIPAWGSRLLVLRAAGEPLAAEPAPRMREVGARALADWALRVEGPGVPDGAYSRAPGALGDWREMEALRNSSAPGTYRSVVSLDALAPGHRRVLDLGRVAGFAAVRVNGRELGVALVPPFALDVTEALVAGENELVVVVTPPRRNGLVPLLESGADGYGVARILGATQRVASGWLGPAVLRELAPR